VWGNILWKFFGRLSLNLPHCAALQTDIETRYLWIVF